MALSLADQAAIGRLSRSDVHATAACLKPFISKSMWLGKTNRYSDKTTVRIKNDAPIAGVRSRNLAQYIATSAILHCSDAWGYLGRASAALLKGDPHRAFHLAYYAELRAAMAILATSGIGVFDRAQYIISGPNTVSKLGHGNGTHMFAWEVLEYWSRSASSGDLFSSIVTPGGRSLDEWLQPFGGASALAPQAREWFQQWGLDIRVGTEDRFARNNSSYRPDGIPVPWTTSPASTLAFLRSSWECLEPSPGSPFEEIDRFILRISIETLYRGRTGLVPSPTAPAFRAFTKQVVDNQNFSDRVGLAWIDFLTRNNTPTDPDIFRLSAIFPGNSQSDHLSVTARAILLLRVACGAVSDLLTEAGVQSSELAFWREGLGTARGLWELNNAPNPISDLYVDIADSLADVDHFQSTTPLNDQSFFRISSDLSHRLPALTSHERVGLWSVLP